MRGPYCSRKKYDNLTFLVIHVAKRLLNHFIPVLADKATFFSIDMSTISNSSPEYLMNSLSGNSAPTIGRPSRVRPIEAADDNDDVDEAEDELAAARTI